MAIECAVITALFIVIVIAFLRKKRKTWAIATLPLTLVPFTEAFMFFVFAKLFSVSVDPFIRIIVLLVAVAVSCVWIGCASGSIKNKKRRATYIGITNLFNVLLAAILVNNVLTQMSEVGVNIG